MKDQKVSTALGTAILIIIAATVAGFVLICFKNYPVEEGGSLAIIEHDKIDIESSAKNEEDDFQADVDGAFVSSPFVESWKQYTNQYRDHAISMPADFDVQDEEPTHIDISSPDYDGVSEGGIRIQIQKNLPPEDHDTVVDFKNDLIGAQDASIIVKKMGDDIDVSYYSISESEGNFMTYFAFDEKKDVYYKIIVFEPGYSQNQELVESIVKTFVIL